MSITRNTRKKLELNDHSYSFVGDNPGIETLIYNVLKKKKTQPNRHPTTGETETNERSIDHQKPPGKNRGL
jgi:hypothetical protein